MPRTVLELSSGERAELARGPVTRERHAALLEELHGIDAVEVQAPPQSRPAPDALVIVVWNAERGRFLDGAARLLAGAGADVLLLSELDCGMARSGQRHTARDLAAKLGCGYAYGVEFVELGLGDERERDAHAGEQNARGLHGGAILSPLPLGSPELVRLDRSGRWFDGELGERRVGGRIAVLATVALATGPLELASVHLESHSDPEHRAAQLAQVFDAVERRSPGGVAVVAGDVNTSSLGLTHLRDRALLERALAEDPQRLARPWPHEPLFALAEARGYDWRTCNDLAASTQRRRRPNAQGTLHLDWVFCRGLAAEAPAVLPALDPEIGAPLSDHEALAVRVTLA